MRKKIIKPKLKDLKCSCRGSLVLLDDSEAETPAPSFLSKLFTCNKCKQKSWCEPFDFNADDWYDFAEFDIDNDDIARSYYL